MLLEQYGLAHAALPLFSAYTSTSVSSTWPYAVQTENKFKCPCHGSQYNNEGKVVRGPAPLVSPLLKLQALLM